jgi:hypothetical protein
VDSLECLGAASHAAVSFIDDGLMPFHTQDTLVQSTDAQGLWRPYSRNYPSYFRLFLQATWRLMAILSAQDRKKWATA